VYNDEAQGYLDYTTYQPLVEEVQLDYIPPLARVKNGSYDHFIHVLGNNNLFIQDGKGTGEGIVLKNYQYYNKFGNQTWAKIITSEFKEKHHKTMGCPETEKTMVEERIASEYVTQALVDKTHAKIVADGGWSSRSIPRLLETVYHDVVTEELWTILKKNKEYKIINFPVLKHFVFKQVKLSRPDLF